MKTKRDYLAEFEEAWPELLPEEKLMVLAMISYYRYIQGPWRRFCWRWANRFGGVK
jgi:hypothetical protein